ncbi:MAG: transcriptional regulator, GntR family [Chloroflexi bacterium]|nr:transcriptional regulator, GntR family [Chloroflexota bacterium]MDB5074687.1 transcriptional regulator, GntR family [Chloroflexota bacterium]
MLEQVRIPRVYSLVVEQIRALIDSGQLKPGDKLPNERSLAEQLGISRSSVREALSALEVLGVIHSRQGLGNYVANNAPTELPEEQFEDLIVKGGPFEIIEARQLFEPGVAALAAVRRTDADLAAIWKCIEDMEAQLALGADAWEPDWGFHVALANACHNPVITAIAELITQRVSGRLWLLMREHNYASDPARPRLYLDSHRRIFEAIQRGDPRAAEEALRQDLAEITKDLSENSP